MKLLFLCFVFMIFYSVSARRKACSIEDEIHCSEMKEKCLQRNNNNCDLVHTGCLTSHKCNRVHKKKNQIPTSINVGIKSNSF